MKNKKTVILIASLLVLIVGLAGTSQASQFNLKLWTWCPTKSPATTCL